MRSRAAFWRFEVIIPTLNEAGTIGDVVAGVIKHCPGAKILVVDDASTDGTPEKVRRLIDKGYPVELLERQGERKGLTASVLAGLAKADRDVVAVMDGDGQHPAEKLPELVSRLGRADLAVAVRDRVEGHWPLHRKLMSYAAQALARARLAARGIACSDPLSGYFCVRRELFQQGAIQHRAVFSGREYKVLFDLLKSLQRNARIAELPYVFRVHSAGQSKMGLRQVVAFMRSLAT